MDIMEAIRERHSVRSYTEKAIEGGVKEEFPLGINKCKFSIDFQAAF